MVQAGFLGLRSRPWPRRRECRSRISPARRRRTPWRPRTYSVIANRCRHIGPGNQFVGAGGAATCSIALFEPGKCIPSGRRSLPLQTKRIDFLAPCNPRRATGRRRRTGLRLRHISPRRRNPRCRWGGPAGAGGISIEQAWRDAGSFHMMLIERLHGGETPRPSGPFDRAGIVRSFDSQCSTDFGMPGSPSAMGEGGGDKGR